MSVTQVIPKFRSLIGAILKIRIIPFNKEKMFLLKFVNSTLS